MRQDATLAENTLWQAIRNKQFGGLKFKRQFPLEIVSSILSVSKRG